MNKEQILEEINKSIETPVGGRNSMGCSENNYNPYFAIGKCFTSEELAQMEETQIKSLIKLGEYLSDAFY